MRVRTGLVTGTDSRALLKEPFSRPGADGNATGTRSSSKCETSTLVRSIGNVHDVGSNLNKLHELKIRHFEKLMVALNAGVLKRLRTPNGIDCSDVPTIEFVFFVDLSLGAIITLASKGIK